MSRYYEGKIETLKEVFGCQDVVVEGDVLHVQDKTFPIIQDVIILLDEPQYTPFVKSRLQSFAQQIPERSEHFAPDIQYSFGEEWKRYDEILSEHRQEFSLYFDLVDLNQLKEKRVCDLGCGNGRWSYFLHEMCQEIMLVDFSDAIFTARKNLSQAHNALFFMGDITALPFVRDFADFVFCVGVLHHLPTPCLEEVKRLKKYAPELLIFLYYAFDNRPVYFLYVLRLITALRAQLCKIQDIRLRNAFALFGTYALYLPAIYLGKFLRPFGLSSYVPLYDFYHDKSMTRIQQDVYDRFFTSIEQRVTRTEILTLRDTFSEVLLAEYLPYWHFICRR